MKSTDKFVLVLVASLFLLIAGCGGRRRQFFPDVDGPDGPHDHVTRETHGACGFRLYGPGGQYRRSRPPLNPVRWRP